MSGYNPKEDLTIKSQGETPRIMVDRMLTKTGPVEETIRIYSQSENIDPDCPEGILLSLSGVFVAAMGRRAQRKFLESDPKEKIGNEWNSALNAHNFVAEVVDRLGLVDETFTKKMETAKPGWEDIKIRAVANLKNSGINNFSAPGVEGEVRRQILLVEYEYLKKNTTKMALMIYLACQKYNVSGILINGLTDTIMNKHYPRMPEYKPEEVKRERPLAYETKILEFWKSLIGTLDD